MTVDLVIGLAAEAIKVTLLLAAPMLSVGLVIGLIVSIFQAVTQIQEMTLTFVPKIVAVMLALVVALPWMINLMITYTRELFQAIPMYIR